MFDGGFDALLAERLRLSEKLRRLKAAMPMRRSLKNPRSNGKRKAFRKESGKAATIPHARTFDRVESY